MADRLYVNVQRADIQGGADALCPIVQEMDKRLQELAQETENIKEIMLKFQTSNSSDQYDRACNVISAFSNFLFDKSEELNDMQVQIVEYQNSTNRYNEKSGCFSNPNSHDVRKVIVDVDVQHFQFTLDEMRYVNQSIETYIKNAEDISNQLLNNKNEVGSIWRDPQYEDFSQFIDEVVTATKQSLTIVNDYSIHLNQQIAEYNN